MCCCLKYHVLCTTRCKEGVHGYKIVISKLSLLRIGSVVTQIPEACNETHDHLRIFERVSYVRPTNWTFNILHIPTATSSLR